MRKQHILLLAALFISCAVQAQIHYYHAPAPWTGDNVYLFTVGSYLQPAPVSLNAIDYKQGVPLTLSFRYDGEEALGTHFVMGFQAELNCNLYHTTYTLDGDTYVFYSSKPYSGRWVHHDQHGWNLLVEVRYLAGYYIDDNWELQLGAGIYSGLLSNRKDNIHCTVKATGEPTPSTHDEGKTAFDWRLGFSGLFSVNYYFNDNFFATTAAKVRIPFKQDIETQNNIPNYSLLVGVGYKFIR